MGLPSTRLKLPSPSLGPCAMYGWHAIPQALPLSSLRIPGMPRMLAEPWTEVAYVGHEFEWKCPTVGPDEAVATGVRRLHHHGLAHPGGATPEAEAAAAPAACADLLAAALFPGRDADRTAVPRATFLASCEEYRHQRRQKNRTSCCPHLVCVIPCSFLAKISPVQSSRSWTICLACVS